MNRKILSLYSGGGGLDIGLEAAGFQTTVAVDSDRWSCETIRHNRPRWNVLEQDIHQVDNSDLARIGGFAGGDLALLVGGPPCQPFSKSGFWARGETSGLNDPRADTLTAYLRILRDLKPRSYLIENVFGLAYKSEKAISLLRHSIDQINREEGTRYSFNLGLLNAADFGVPQIRERLFITGSIDGAEFVFPTPTHGQNPDERMDLFPVEPWLTAWDAIGDLEKEKHPELKMTGKWADLLPSIPEGKNYLHHTNRGGGEPIFGWRTRYWSFLLKLAKERPSWTIQAQPGSAIGPFHWKNRRLSMREMCRLQTIPDDYEILGSPTEIQRQLGNAVPSVLGELLGLEIRKQFLGERVSTKQLCLRTEPNPNPFKKYPTRRLHKKYASMIGNYPDHPGSGKGPQARRSS